MNSFFRLNVAYSENASGGALENPSVTFDNASIANIPVLTDFVEEKLSARGCSLRIINLFSISIDEIYSNIVKFAYPEKPGAVTVQLLLNDPERISLKFVDSGVPYNPLETEDPDITLAPEERGIGGLGIFMVKQMMDEIEYKYEYKDHKNMLTITKKI